MKERRDSLWMLTFSVFRPRIRLVKPIFAAQFHGNMPSKLSCGAFNA